MGIDPAQRMNGLAFRFEGGPVTTASFDGIENILSCEVLKEAASGEVEAFAVIECPTWSGPGTKETRSAALAWERVLQKLFTRRHIWRVCPNEWQKALLVNCPGSNTKERSAFRVAQLGMVAANDHEADALCLMEYAQTYRAQLLMAKHKPGTAAQKSRKKVKK